MAKQLESLKPCPFCGSKGEVKDRRLSFSVICTNPDCDVYVSGERSPELESEAQEEATDWSHLKQTAIDRWNNLTMTKPLEALIVRKGDAVIDNYYLAKCDICEEMFTSERMEGGEPVADTGDYGDCYCPYCSADDSEIADYGSEEAVEAWNFQQKHIDPLRRVSFYMPLNCGFFTSGENYEPFKRHNPIYARLNSAIQNIKKNPVHMAKRGQKTQRLFIRIPKP